MAFVQRQLTIKFTLATKTFAESGTNTLTLSNLRASAKIQNAGGATKPMLQLSVYGMTLSQMDDISTLGMTRNLVANNQVTVSAGDAGGMASNVFSGTIFNAWEDFGSAPEVPFRVDAAGLFAASVLPVQSSSFPGAVDVATALSGLATKMGLNFQNNGVTAKLSGQYLYGSAYDQAIKIVRAAGIGWNAGENGTLSIWPRDGSRGDSGVTISPTTGMVGYPTYTQLGIQLRTVFNPAIQFGQMVKIQSQLKAANQTVRVQGLDHDLDALDPSGGQWFSTIKGYNPNEFVNPPS